MTINWLYLTPALDLSRVHQNRTTVKKNNKKKSRVGILAAVRTLAEEKRQGFTAYFLFSAFYKQQ